LAHSPRHTEKKEDMDSQRPAQSNKVQRVEVYWHAVSYKTVALILLLAAALIFVSIYFVFPNVYAYVVKKVTEAGTPIRIRRRADNQK